MRAAGVGNRKYAERGQRLKFGLALLTEMFLKYILFLIFFKAFILLLENIVAI